MKNLPRRCAFFLLVTSILPSPISQLAAADAEPPQQEKSGGAILNFRDTDIGRLARSWRRAFGGAVTIADRARSKKVSISISASSKEELRKMFVTALRENGVYVIERSDGVVFDTEPEKQSK